MSSPMNDPSESAECMSLACAVTGQCVLSNKDIQKYHFAAAGNNSFKCLQCKKLYKGCNGAGNTVQHAKSKHALTYEAYVRAGMAFEQNEKAQRNHPTMMSFVAVNDPIQNLFRWIELVVMNDMPTTMVSNKLFRRSTNLRPICVNTLMRGLRKLHGRVRQDIADSLPENFALMFDGWDSGLDHLVATFAVYPHPATGKQVKVLLGLQNLLDDASQTADNHVESFIDLLESYGRSIEDLWFIIADNCSTNCAIARRLGVPLIGCASHLLALAVKYLLQQYDDVVTAVDKVFSIISRSNNKTNKLARHTHLTCLHYAKPRWPTRIDQAIRYQKLAPVLDSHAMDIGGADLVNKVLSAPMKAKLAEMLTLAKPCRECMIDMQRDDLTMSERADYFETLVDYLSEYPLVRQWLAPYGGNVPCAQFQAGIVKVMQKRYAELLPGELELLEIFKKPAQAPTAPVAVDGVPKPVSFVERAQQLSKNRVAEGDQTYIDLSWIPPTSNEAERLFSKTKMTFRDRRRSMKPATLEMLTCLRYNREKWRTDMFLDLNEEPQLEADFEEMDIEDDIYY